MTKGIALLRPNYRRLSEDQPYGTPHSCYQLCKTIAESGRYTYTDIFDEDLYFAGADYPFQSQGSFRSLAEMSLYLDDYRCAYLSNDLMYYVSHNLRLPHQAVPLIAEIGTAHSDDQWKNIFLAAVTGKIAKYDGFIFKSVRAQNMFLKTAAAWREQFGLQIEPQVCFIPNGIDIEDNKRSLTLRKECRDHLMYRDDDVVFLAFNRVAPTTKVDYESLILNWRQVIQENPKAKLLIAGAKVSYPDYRDYPLFLRNLARKLGMAQYVTILENPYEIFRSARNSLMSAADAFIHTAKGMQETSSLTILEAMSHSMPVIVGDWSGAGDVVKAGEDGIIVKTISAEVPMDLEANTLTRFTPFYNGALEENVACDAGELIQAVLTLSRSDELRHKMGRVARANIESTYTLQAVTERRIDFFEQCVKLAESDPKPQASVQKKILFPDLMVREMGGYRLSPSSLVGLGEDDHAWLEHPRWAEHSDLSLKILDTLASLGDLSAGEIFLRIFGRNCSEGSGEWAVFSGILIKMASINLVRCTK